MKVAIFDLDDTLADTKALEEARRARQWKQIGSSLLSQSFSFTGMAEALSTLRSEGVRVAVVTRSPDQYAKTILTHHQLLHPSDIVIGYHQVRARKPDPEAVRTVERMVGFALNNENCVGIGDSSHDLEMCHAAGLRCFGASWSRWLELSLAWDGLFKEPDEIVTYFRGLKSL